MVKDSPIKRLTDAARGASNSLIVIQNIPDPDAIASAAALRHILAERAGVNSVIAHEGMVGRAENRGLLRYLALELAQIPQLRIESFDLISTVDTQPQFTNNSLPEGVRCNIVIDHHDTDGETASADFVDVRPDCGATSTILTEYLRSYETGIDIRLATALLYGIKSDTQDLGRESTLVDVQAFLFLYPRANKFALAQIEHEGVSRDHFITLHKALEDCRQYGYALISFAGDVKVPEIIAEIADELLRFDQAEYVLVHGVCKKQLVMSVRTKKIKSNAHSLMRAMVQGVGSGGGHMMLAGGQIPLDGGDVRRIVKLVEERFLTGLTLTGAKPVKFIGAVGS